ncbi:MAG: type II toxin-antitoxin system HipA family toxin, partial [Acidithiobacillus sp.]
VVSVGDSGYHTFCVKRFDRVKGVRRFYASAMTLLGKEDNAEGSNSYLELAQFLSNHGDPAFIGADLAQLFRRVAFNVAVGNRDDHLRNHGFILGKQGWRLAPAFDVNPNLDKDAHVLNIDDVDNRPSLATVAATAEFYRLTPQDAAVIVEEVAQVVDGWEKEAKLCGLRQEDCLEMARSFEAHEEYRQR